MRSVVTTAMAVLALGITVAGSTTASAVAVPGAGAQRTLARTLNADITSAGAANGAYVVDLTARRILYSYRPHSAHHPGSVEKVYTTSAALADFGHAYRLKTSVYGIGRMRGRTFVGTLYLRGGGDPTFGSTAYDQALFGTGATVEQLVRDLIRDTGIRALRGTIVADESLFDAVRGTPATGYAPSFYLEGELSALSFDRDWTTVDGTAFWPRPALESGLQFQAALQQAGVRMSGTRVRAGVTPKAARALTAVGSPRLSDIVYLTNTPSDTFFAETLTKDLGAYFGRGGTTADGAAVIRATIAAHFGLHPRLDDGSGLSRYDHTTPFDLVTLLTDQRHDPYFTNSLAIGGETGTLRYQLAGTYAAGRCRGKTGTLYDESNVTGYCQARDGHVLAYAFMLSHIAAGVAHPIEAAMQTAVAEYDG